LRGIVLHRAGDWTATPTNAPRRLHQLAPALLLAAASFGPPRPACGILAASVQQRLLRADDLRRALTASPRIRHRAALLLAVGDIEQGAHALSEIDFARLCAKHRLPRPNRQAIRKEPSGRRRYLDVEWELPDGRRIVAEIDGAAHIAVEEWVPDQLRQNDVAIGGALVLRYPSVVVRHNPELVIAQLRRVLAPLGC
jgi:hypothetical protein